MSSTGHGGARQGAGRKKGSVNKRAREMTEGAFDRIEATGDKLPIEVMYAVMTEYFGQWVTKTAQPDSTKEAMEAAERAAYWADRCAPYFHARYAAVDVNPDGESEDQGSTTEPWETPKTGDEAPA